VDGQQTEAGSAEPDDAAARRDEFRSLIADHASRPVNFGELAGENRTGVGENPICGDRCRVALRVTADRIEAVRFTGVGCAISIASASMMTEAVDGLTLHDAELLSDRVRKFLTDRAAGADETWGDLLALAGVRDYPRRVKCATLPWHTLRAALRGEPDAVSTE
jgi:nitrogen fixation NifU-like protein